MPVVHGLAVWSHLRRRLPLRQSTPNERLTLATPYANAMKRSVRYGDLARIEERNVGKEQRKRLVSAFEAAYWSLPAVIRIMPIRDYIR